MEGEIEMKKLEMVKDICIVVVILVICSLLLKVSYDDGVKNCTDYGYDESYCKSELSK